MKNQVGRRCTQIVTDENLKTSIHWRFIYISLEDLFDFLLAQTGLQGEQNHGGDTRGQGRQGGGTHSRPEKSRGADS